MNTVLTNNVRRYPSNTKKRFERIDAEGTAYISERAPGSYREQLAWGWQKVSDQEMYEAIEEGYDIWYKTANLGGAHKCYVRKQS